MTDASPAYQRFLAELKRRNVFRVMAVYGIVGFLVLQVVDLAVPALLLPDWTYRLVALLLLVGLPVAVVLAWVFEQTPHGLKRTGRAAPTEIDAIVAAPIHQRGAVIILRWASVTGRWRRSSSTSTPPATRSGREPSCWGRSTMACATTRASRQSSPPTGSRDGGHGG